PKMIASDEYGTNQYQLTIRKQAGSVPESASISVTLPNGAKLIEANPKPSAINGEMILFDIILDTDKIMTLTYQ
ncbi:MAG: hypothetical protein GWP17_06145, partial [Aquificales bacterium]|nr:hypothetical protein [Aquificales bacterium]